MAPNKGWTKEPMTTNSITNYGDFYHKPTCPNCGSTNFTEGAGLKPQQVSLKCSECKAFLGYRNLQKLKKLKHQKRLTPCLELLEKQGLRGDVAIFVLGRVEVEA